MNGKRSHGRPWSRREVLQTGLKGSAAAMAAAYGLRPDFALAHNNLGGVLRELEQIDEALAAYREAVRLAPNLPLALSNLGQLLLEKGEKDEAEKYCKEAVRLAPNFPEGLSNLGNVLRAKDNMKDAKDCYRIALKMRPKVAMIHGNLGQALQQEGNLEEAIKCYNQAAALDPKSPRFESHLASALADKEDWTGAEQAYVRLARLLPTADEQRAVYEKLGELYSGPALNLSRAEVAYKEVLKRAPNDLAVLTKLVEPYRQTDRDEAMACLKAQGGLEKCSLAFYKEGDLGNDKVWDCWRLEGPAFVWYFRGAPHVHVWVNIASDPSVKTNSIEGQYPV